jgi:large subunit ribosomal protein L6
MSRIGKRPVALPSGVSATTEGQILSVKGPKGTLQLQMREEISYDVSDEGISVQPANETKAARAFWGMQRTLVQNLVTGVTDGFTKTLEITGVGYRAQAQGRTLNLTLGFSHPVVYAAPEGITIETPSQTEIVVKGADKQRVGQVAAEIRGYRSPEPYKGKGVRYSGERIELKETKKK